MAPIIATIVLLHVAALAGVLILARHSVVLVDEQGRPLGGPSPWTEQRIPAPSVAPASPFER
ncbi:MAG TPA: hypothetical protein V6D47_03510 [Oscillatoriaceae cyanobacterium]